MGRMGLVEEGKKQMFKVNAANGIFARLSSEINCLTFLEMPINTIKLKTGHVFTIFLPKTDILDPGKSSCYHVWQLTGILLYFKP